MRNLEAALIVNNLKGHPIESVEIAVKIPVSYAALLVTSERVCDALEKDLNQFLASKWKVLNNPLTKRWAKRQP
jgi:hypothetical protein